MMQENISISSKVVDFIKAEIQQDQTLEIDPQADLLATGMVESMSMMRLIQFIEDAFNISVDPEDLILENFVSIEAIEKFTLRKMQS